MSVPNLEDIIISKMVSQQWLASPLPVVLRDLLYDKQDQYKNCKNQVSGAITNACNEYVSTMASKNIPTCVQQRWAVTFCGMAAEAFETTMQLYKAVRPRLDFAEVKPLVKLIAFSQNCEVDTAKIVLGLLKYRNMNIRFLNLNVLSDCLILKSDLTKVYESLLAQVAAKAEFRTPKIVAKERQKLTNSFNSLMESYNDYRELCQRAASSGDLGAHDMFFKNYKILQYWINIARPSEEATMVFTSDLFFPEDKKGNKIVQPEKLMVLIEYLGMDKFVEATLASFENVFKSLVSSWRSRHYCVGLVVGVTQRGGQGGRGRLDAPTLRALLAALKPHLETHTMGQMALMLGHLWPAIPPQLKDDRTVYNCLPTLFKDSQYYPGFLQLLSEYDAIKANGILLATLKLKEVTRCSPAYLSTLKHLVRDVRKLFGDKHEMYLTNKQLKMLINTKSEVICMKVFLDSLMAVSRVNELSFKRSLSRDVDFIKSVLSKSWGNTSILEFFHWLFEDDARAAAVYLKRTAPLVVHPVLVQKLLRPYETLATAAATLVALRLDPRAKLNLALWHSDVKAALVTKMLKHAMNSRNIDSDWHLLLSDRVTMTKLLLSTMGKDKILAMLTKHTRDPCKETSTKFIVSDLKALMELKSVCEGLLEPAELCAPLEASLARAGHPNASPEFDHLPGDRSVRAEIDFRYRCFRAMLRGARTLPDFKDCGAKELTLVSIEFAAQAQSQVPVVI